MLATRVPTEAQPSRPPTAPSIAATIATSDAGFDDPEALDEQPDESSYEGLDWDRVPDLMKPLTVSKRNTSWIYRYGYRCVRRSDPKIPVFVCKYCHRHKIPHGQYVAVSTTSAACHLKQSIAGHGYDKNGVINKQLKPA